jgi:hypothetical protein
MKSVIKELETETLRDLRDVELRRQNVMIFGMKEDTCTSPSERKAADARQVDALSSALGLNNALQYQSLIRLGKPSDKPRPVKLIGLHYRNRDELLRSAKKILA